MTCFLSDKFASYVLIAALVRNHQPTIDSVVSMIKTSLVELFQALCFKIFVVRVLRKIDSPSIQQIMRTLRKADRRQLLGHRDLLLVYWLCVLTFATAEDGCKHAANLADLACEELQIGRQCAVANLNLPY